MAVEPYGNLSGTGLADPARHPVLLDAFGGLSGLHGAESALAAAREAVEAATTRS